VSRKALIGVAAAILLVAVAAVGLQVRSTLVAINLDAGIGRDELLAGAHIVKADGANLTAERSSQAAAFFQSAQSHFRRAGNVLRQDAIVRFLARLPWIADQVEAATELSDMGVHLSRTGELGVDALKAALPEKTPESSAPGNPGVKVLQTLDALDPKLSAILAEIDQAAASHARIPRAALLPPLTKAVRQLDQKVDISSLRDAVVGLRAQEPAIRRLLGGAAAQTYLVLQQDPAELRATGGFIGSVGFLTFDDGKMAPFNPVDVYAVERNATGQLYGFAGASTGVPPPAPLAKTFGLNSWTLRDSNWSPDFPTSAAQAEFLLKKEGGKDVDGVIAIDPYFIARLLTVIGPTTVPETGDIVDANNFFATTLNRVELNANGAAHKSFLSFAAKAIFARLLTVPPSKWLSMLDVLGWGCNSRSLQAHFTDAYSQELVDRYHCGGQLVPLNSDGLMVVDSNLGGNKDDFWLQRKYALQIELNPDGSAQHTLHIHYSGLTPHGVELTKYWGYTGWLRIYLPPSSSLMLASGAELTQATDLGRRVLQGWVYVPFFSSLDVTVAYRVGASDMHASNGRLDLVWQKQAGRPADLASVEVTPPSGWKLASAQVGKAQLPDPVSTNLSVDRDFAFIFRRS
jgi:hypothetical protein